MQTTPITSQCFGRIAGRCWALALICLMAAGAFAQQQQERMERQGVVLHWGLMSADGLPQQIVDVHGGKPVSGGKVHHLVLALFDAKTGQRIDNAIIRAQLSEPGIVDGPAKYVPLMTMKDEASYGQVFGMVRDGPYRFKVKVKLPDRPHDIEYAILAVPQGPVRR
jgi:hypothetical protein